MCIKCELLDITNKDADSYDPKSTLLDENYSIFKLNIESTKSMEAVMKGPLIKSSVKE